MGAVYLWKRKTVFILISGPINKMRLKIIKARDKNKDERRSGGGGRVGKIAFVFGLASAERSDQPPAAAAGKMQFKKERAENN